MTGAGGATSSATGGCADPSCGIECTVPATAPSNGACVVEGDNGVLCNPVTNHPCMAGEACDVAPGGFRCYGPPNDANVCDSCNGPAGPHCAGGYTCPGEGKCARFCCTDGDCGAGVCDMIIAGYPVGICKSMGGSTSSVSSSNVATATVAASSSSMSSSAASGGGMGMGGMGMGGAGGVASGSGGAGSGGAPADAGGG